MTSSIWRNFVLSPLIGYIYCRKKCFAYNRYENIFLAKRFSDRVGRAKRLVFLRCRAQAGANLGQGMIYVDVCAELDLVT